MNRNQRRATEAQQKAALHRANARLRAEMGTAYRQLDVLIESKVALVAADTHVPCRKGCAHCCEQMLTVTLIEAQYLVMQYPAVIAQAIPELLRQEEQLKALGVHMLTPGRSEEAERARQAFLDRWYQARIPCALLDPKTKECRVYAARPIGCRAHYAQGHGPEICDLRPDPNSTDATPMMQAIDMTDEAITSEPSIAIAKLTEGPTLIMGPLPILLLHLMTKRGMGEING